MLSSGRTIFNLVATPNGEAAVCSLPIAGIGGVIDSGEFICLLPIQCQIRGRLRLVHDRIPERDRFPAKLLIHEQGGLLGGVGLDLSGD